MLVYIQDRHGNPLMPCKPSKARKLLKDGKAKIVNYNPFTIQLQYGSTGYTQPVTLGVDAGSKHIGISASTENEELFSIEVELRSDIVKNISTRREYRRGRRNRKTRYREARWQNRKKKDGWLAPSVQSKINSHLKIISNINKILPIAKTVVEVAAFDIQKIKNPNIQGEQYQQGEQLDFWNTREYVLFRDEHKCKGKKDCNNKILNVHHIESRKTGGDAPNNLITLCEECHNEYHKGILKLSIKRGQSFRDAAFMGIMRWAFYYKLKEVYNNVSLTYGYLTKNTRISNNLEKTHTADAYCIAGNLKAKRGNSYIVKQKRKKKRSLHEATPRKGRKEPNVTARRNCKNTKQIIVSDKTWCLLDKVKVGDKIGFISGFTGNMAYIQDINGKYIQTTDKYKQVSVKNLELMCRNNNWIWNAIHPAT